MKKKFLPLDIVKIKEMLVDRAKKHKKELLPELQFIYNLKNALEEYCKDKDTSIKIVMLKEFSNDLDNIINLYNDLPKKIIYKRKKPIDIDTL